MSKSLDLKVLISVFKKVWWKVLILTVIVATGMGLVAQFIIPNKYASTVEFMVVNDDTNSDFVSSDRLNAAAYLVTDYARIITGDKMVEIVKEYISDPARDTSGTYAQLTDDDIRHAITSNTSDGRSIFSITATTKADRNLAFYIAECISLKGPEVIQEIKDSEKKCVTVIRNPVPAEQPSSPGVLTYVAVSGLFTAAISYVLFVVIKLFDNVIVTEDDIKEKLNKTVIGDIPEWFSSAATRKEDN